MSTATTKEQVASQVRTITIVSTRGEKAKIAYEGSDWAGLKSLLTSGGKNVNGKAFSKYDLSNMKCVESIKRNTLEHPNAVLPDGDFNLFLMPQKSKSGAELSRAEAYAKIKGFIAENESKAKAHFNADEKNYTVKSTVVLNQLIESYKPGTKKAVSKEKAEAISDVVTSVRNAKEEDLFETLQGLSVDEKLDVVIKLLSDMRTKGVSEEGKVSEAFVAPAPVKSQEEIEKEEKAAKEEEEQRLAKEKADEEEKERKRLEKEEDDKLQKEMRELAGGFNDVRL